ncbi:MAG TPA: single-stranded DNA-binding protein [Blastocatellia bacterium]|nr:single-stranded DNA-binding protein [Blastocatellia bacterium]
MSFNRITIVGNLGRDPELKQTPQGQTVCKFPVATSEKRRNAAGEMEELTTWFRVSVWGRQAELANEYLSKGRQVYVEGRLRLEEYTDREGVTRTSAEVNATDIQFIGQRQEQGGTQFQPDETPSKPAAKPAAKAAAAPQRNNKVVVPVQDDDIPF